MTPSISLSIWKSHFPTLLQKKSSYYHFGAYFPQTENERITEDEVWQTMKRSKPDKVAGPDNILNELMKRAMLFTITVDSTIQQMPGNHGYSHNMERINIKVGYKGKGPQNVLDSYRGITLKCAPFKILNNILLKDS